MRTDLFTAVSGVSPSALARVIPPACRCPVGSARVTVEDDAAVLEGPAWSPRHGARHLVPSLCLLGATACSFRFELSALCGSAWTPWVATATIGPPVFGDVLVPPDVLMPEIDMYVARQPVDQVRLRVRVQPARALTAAWLLSLSASDLASTSLDDDGDGSAPLLRVPARSQMEEAPVLRERICSPTCVAMVLGFWGRRVSVSALAADVFHEGLDRYGVWPAAIHAAARCGVAGYVLRFPGWSSALWCLRQGLPVIASIRFEPGELEGAPIARTDGHLVVLVGAEGDQVLVNDPAGASERDVPRRYRRDQFLRVWLQRGGVGYVLFERSGTLL